MPQPDSSTRYQKDASPVEDIGTNHVSNMELLYLPDLPMQTIVTLIPLQPLITALPRLHPRFSPFRETALRSNRHLQLFIGNQYAIENSLTSSPFRIPYSRYLIDFTGQPLYPETDFHRLILGTLESRTVDQLTSLMPAISNLTVHINGGDILIISQLIRLLNLWSSTLKSFTFSCVFTDLEWDHLSEREKERTMTVFGYMLLRLIGAINTKLTALEQLTLNINESLLGYGVPNEVLQQALLPILGRLKDFNFASGDLADNCILSTLTQVDANTTTLEKIGIGMTGSWTAYLDAFPPTSNMASRLVLAPNFSPSERLIRAVKLAQALADAPQEEVEGRQEILEEIEFEELGDLVFADPPPATAFLQLQERYLKTFNNLRVFAVELDASRTLGSVLLALSYLRELEVLQVKIEDPRGLAVNLADESANLSLPSVAALTFDHQGYPARHTDLAGPLWARLFPSVQVIMFQHNTPTQFCAICYPNARRRFMRSLGYRYRKVSPCLKQLFAPFSGIPSLRKIFYQRNFGHYGHTGEFSSAGEFVRAHSETIY